MAASDYEDFKRKYGSAPVDGGVTEQQRRYRIEQLNNAVASSGKYGGPLAGLGADIERINNQYKLPSSSISTSPSAAPAAVPSAVQPVAIPAPKPIAEQMYPIETPITKTIKAGIEKTYPSSQGVKSPAQVATEINSAILKGGEPAGPVYGPTGVKAALRPGEFSVVDPRSGKTISGNAAKYVASIPQAGVPRNVVGGIVGGMPAVERAKANYEQFMARANAAGGAGFGTDRAVPGETVREAIERRREMRAEARRPAEYAQQQALQNIESSAVIGKAKEGRAQALDVAKIKGQYDLDVAKIGETAARAKMADAYAEAMKNATDEEKSKFAEALLGMGGKGGETTQTSNPPDAYINRLKANKNNPVFIQDFEKRFGVGSAKKYLGV